MTLTLKETYSPKRIYFLVKELTVRLNFFFLYNPDKVHFPTVLFSSFKV